MDSRDPAGTARPGRDRDRSVTRRRGRLVPPAVTPVGLDDVAAGILGQLRGGGRDRFRRDLETLLDAESAATYTSFRRALAACFHELAAGAPDDRRAVLLPAFCSSDFPDAVEGVGLTPVRYDVDPGTLAVDAASLASALGADTLAVVAVNVLGYASPMDELAQRCADRDVALVEALGYALGTEYEGAPLGTYGDCAVVNFQQGKPIPVGGGMVLGQDPALSFDDAGRPAVDPNVAALSGYATLSRPRAYYVYSRAKHLLERAGMWGDRATTHPESKFDVAYDPPFATPSDFQGTVAHRVFGRLADHRRQRARTAEFYREALSSCPRVEFVEPVAGLAPLQHVRFPLLAATTDLRDRLRTALVEAGVQATTLYDWPTIDPDQFPGAAHLQRHILTLPTHPYVDARDRQLVVDTVRAVASHDRQRPASG
jgi:dTDP-4-amino-4,6-dideoxygalactose transaminase